MVDVVIIGAGPAGISASIYAKRGGLDVLVLYYGDTNLKRAEKIDNYYGFRGGIEGDKLYEDGINQAIDLGVNVKKSEVVAIENQGTKYVVKTSEESIETKAVILSTGNRKLKPHIPGIKEFEGKGISYCAICDAFFYRNKHVAVIGNGKFALNEAEKLANIAKEVTILTNGLEAPNTEYGVNTKNIKCINGDTKVRNVEFEDGSIKEVDGIFIAIGNAGASDFAKTLGVIQNGEYIKVDENMHTNLKGVFACGDVTGGLLQISKAVYEGAKAGLSAVEYIRNK